ncbi:GerAB/ArcD/ProY family transporter [Heliophilum fasciatum]|uniref:Spore germination protein (Amino acid permease) n=1 Tax=Heliophilum fasciatum TaxID=35700 RepID=A0A4R2RNT6_9FIRM|nr:GerAB/ArcD/ProY family transporter [Heliophilum fasciatum]MCW2279074.1 spore germination protein (amino acid permease) [Heliophilum fasciatum]TCP61471.1 spore germination protein (amino acid permease) [Heliophilum fasciatum]
MESFFLIAAYFSPAIFLGLPRLYATDGGSALWLMPFIIFLFLIPVLWMIVHLYKNYPDQSLVQIIGRLWGPWAQPLAGLFFCVFFVIFTGLFLRQFSVMINVSMLATSQPSVTILPLLLAGIIGALQGPQIISRTNWVLMPLNLGIFLIMIAASLRTATPVYIAPLLGPGIDLLLWRSFLRTPTLLDILIIPVLFPFFRQLSHCRMSTWYGLGFVVFMYSLGLLAFGMNFPAEASSDIAFPLFQLARNISIGRFFQRLEVLFVVVWVILSLLKVMLSLYAAAACFSHGIGAPYYRPYIWPMAVLIYTVAFIPVNYLVALHWEWNYLRNAMAPVFVLILISLILLHWRKTKNKSELPREGEQLSAK